MDPSTPHSPRHNHNFHRFLPPPPLPLSTQQHLSPSPSPSPNTPKAPSPLVNHIKYLLTPLNRLISVSTGQSHRSFPTNLLSYRLLTSSQLDDLARHYHQVHPPVLETGWYPVTITPWIRVDGEYEGVEGEKGREVDLATKRRRFGRFIGLRGCESPIYGGSREGELGEREEKLLVWIEKEWQAALSKARAEGETGRLGLVRKCNGGGAC